MGEALVNKNVLGSMLFILGTVMFQAIVAMVAHRSQKQYVPGVVSEQLGHESFVFRSHRTFMNSLENVPVMILTAMVALLGGMNSTVLTWILVIYGVCRAIHMILYYVIATEKNPSPRSHFFGIAFLTNIVLVVWTAIILF
eukprot:TRINITY_DN1854_c0_g1_i1.p1 TRINITY_DN1854_c0_g1~~TRINITY_DN1854_c0_g1_i1.p1  ORF type:complete len:141 (-),score=33.77 TRINITY_DN1854_c0_g1_i1:221-643(-)